MNGLPPALERLINDFVRFPGIGKKTAVRLALFVLRRPAHEAKEFARDLDELHDAIRLCSSCFCFSETDPCPVCADPARDRSIICVVEEAGDMMAIEKSGGYRGLYHILHGVLSPMDGIGPEEIKMGYLLKRSRLDEVAEILIATSSTVPGEATASFLAEKLQSEPVKVTRIAFGIPMGMDIKYADDVTLSRAIEFRKDAAYGQ